MPGTKDFLRSQINKGRSGQIITQAKTVAKRSSGSDPQSQLHPDPVIPVESKPKTYVAPPSEQILSGLKQTGPSGEAAAEIVHKQATGTPLPSVEPKTSGEVFKETTSSIIKESNKQIQNIDPKARYKTDTGEIVTGSYLIGQTGMNAARNLRNVNVPSGTYVEKHGTYYQLTPELEYIYRASSQQSKQRIHSGFGRSDTMFGQSVEQAYTSLSPREKQGYRSRFVFPSMSVEEIKQYEGGVEYLQSLPPERKNLLIDQYLKKHPDLQKESLAVRQRDVTSALFPTSSSDVTMGAGTTYQPKSKRSTRDTAWDLITTSEMDLQKKYYNELGVFPKAVLSYNRAFVNTLVFPVTFTQTGYQYVTGSGKLTDFTGRLQTGKQLGPNVQQLLHTQPGSNVGPSGIISTGISEGIDYLFGKKGNERSNAWQKFIQDPLSGISATGGELLGMAILSKGEMYTKNLYKTHTHNLSKQFPTLANKYYKFQYQVAPYRPKVLAKRLFHKYVPMEKVFGPNVRSGKFRMEYVDDLDDMIHAFEKHRTNQGIPIVHGTKYPFKTNLRVRPTAIIRQGDDVLLMKHDSKSMDWLLPGGGKETGESMLKGLSREIKEELGIKITKPKYIGKYADYRSGNLYVMYETGFKGTPTLKGETVQFKWVNMRSQLDDAALHVKDVLPKYFQGNTITNYMFKQGKSSYPQNVVSSGGPRGPGMYFVPEGELSRWPFGFSKKPLQSEYGGLMFTRNKPAVIKTIVDDIARVPEHARKSWDDYVSYMKYTKDSKANTIYLSPKTELGMKQGPHMLELEGILPPGNVFKKIKTGLRNYENTFTNKWYNTWAHVTGYKEFSIVPHYWKTTPIREYRLMGMADNIVVPAGKNKNIFSDFGKTHQQTTNLGKLMYEGVHEVPLLSPSYILTRKSFMSLTNSDMAGSYSKFKYYPSIKSTSVSYSPKSNSKPSPYVEIDQSLPSTSSSQSFPSPAYMPYTSKSSKSIPLSKSYPRITPRKNKPYPSMNYNEYTPSYSKPPITPPTYVPFSAYSTNIKRKKKSSKKSDFIDKGYRFRSLNVRNIEEFIPKGVI